MAQIPQSSGYTKAQFPSLTTPEVGVLGASQSAVFRALSANITLVNLKWDVVEFTVLGDGGTVTYAYPLARLSSIAIVGAVVLSYLRNDTGEPVLGATGWRVNGDNIVFYLGSTPSGIDCSASAMVVY